MQTCDGATKLRSSEPTEPIWFLSSCASDFAAILNGRDLKGIATDRDEPTQCDTLPYQIAPDLQATRLGA